jgi:biotin carboxyl carrier protein
MKLQIEIVGRVRDVELVRDGDSGRYRMGVDGKPYSVEAIVLRPGVLSLILEGRAYRVVLEDHPDEPALHMGGERWAYRVDDARSLKGRRGHAKGSDGPKAIKASMPGRVVRVLAQRGEAVEANQGVVVIEAMKMQNELKSPKAGVVAEMRVDAGDTVAAGDVLAVIE